MSTEELHNFDFDNNETTIELPPIEDLDPIELNAKREELEEKGVYKLSNEELEWMLVAFRRLRQAASPLTKEKQERKLPEISDSDILL